MKCIGIIGGMSWESTADYYRRLNVLARERLGGLHSQRILIDSLDFSQIAQMQNDEDWSGAASLLCDAAKRLEAGGADAVLICSNTMHRSAKDVAAAIGVPFLHIADSLLAEARARDVTRVGLLATRFTMEAEFYREYLAKFGVQVLIPPLIEREEVHRVIYEELCLGKIEDSSRQHYVAIAQGLSQRGAEAVVLGCTEITLLLNQDTIAVPLLDTTELHVNFAFEWSQG